MKDCHMYIGIESGSLKLEYHKHLLPLSHSALGKVPMVDLVALGLDDLRKELVRALRASNVLEDRPESGEEGAQNGSDGQNGPKQASPSLSDWSGPTESK